MRLNRPMTLALGGRRRAVATLSQERKDEANATRNDESGTARNTEGA